MIRFYRIFGVIILLALAWIDFRGWAPGTTEEKEQAQSQGRDSNFRNRSYRGGK